MIRPCVLREPTRGQRRHRCCLRHAFGRACPEHHRRRLARAARSIGARAERERPARGLWRFSWSWPLFSLERISRCSRPLLCRGPAAILRLPFSGEPNSVGQVFDVCHIYFKTTLSCGSRPMPSVVRPRNPARTSRRDRRFWPARFGYSPRSPSSGADVSA